MSLAKVENMAILQSFTLGTLLVNICPPTNFGNFKAHSGAF